MKALSLAICFFALLAPNEAWAGGLKLHFIDCKEGDATLIEWEGGQREFILVDTGNPVTGHSVLEYLRKTGVRRLEAVVITHPHMDHAGGLFQIAQSVNTIALYDNGEDLDNFPGRNNNHRWYKEFLASRPQSASLKAGDSLSLGGEVKLKVLWPPENGFDHKYANARSLVIMVEHGKFRALLAGDLIIPAEQALAGSEASLKAHVLKAGHHGADDTGSGMFLARVSPEVVVVSVNAGNVRGYPDRDVIMRMERNGARVYRTDENGTILLKADASGEYEVITSRQVAGQDSQRDE